MLSYSCAKGDDPRTISYLEPLDLEEVCRCSDPASDTNGNSLLDWLFLAMVGVRMTYERACYFGTSNFGSPNELP
jgi:hypothetical protein